MSLSSVISETGLSELFTQRRADVFTTTVLSTSILVCFAASLYFLFFTYPDYMHSDSAGIVLQAEEMLRSREWISTHWYYVSDAIWLLDSPQVAIPFVAMLGPSVFALSCAAALAAVVFLASAYALGRTSHLGRMLAMAAAMLMVSGASMLYSDILLGMMMTASLPTAMLVLGMLIVALQSTAYRAPAWICAVALVVLFATNPRKALVFVALPVAIALVACAYAKRRTSDGPEHRERFDYLYRAIFYSSIVGVFAHELALPIVHMNVSYAQHPLSIDINAIKENLRIFSELALKFLGMTDDRTGGGWVDTAVLLHRATTLLLMLVFFSLGTLTAFRKGNRAWQFLAVYSLATAALIFAALITGHPIKQDYGIYYLIYATVPGVIVAFSFIAGLPRNISNAILLLVVSPTLLLSMRNHIEGNAGYLGPGINQQTTNEQKSVLIDWLQARGLHHGYAPYWEANTITVLTNARIRVVSATLWLNGLQIFEWGISEHQVNRLKSQRPVFVAVPYMDRRFVIPDVCTGRAKIYELPPYTIYVFDQGIGNCLYD